MERTWKKTVAACAVVVALVAALVVGGRFLGIGDAPQRPAAEETGGAGQTDTAPSGAAGEAKDPNDPAVVGDPNAGKDQYLTDPVPEGRPQPVEPGTADIDTGTTQTCTISISCATILDNMDQCSEAKRALIPPDGVILPASVVSFSPGESVFDLLQRVCRENRIHMESSWTPMYNSAYIEGIYNLYEFDVGQGSGWMYSVNGWFPNYGCSRYQIKSGDVICWVYTCDLGYDIGGGYMGG